MFQEKASDDIIADFPVPQERTCSSQTNVPTTAISTSVDMLIEGSDRSECAPPGGNTWFEGHKGEWGVYSCADGEDSSSKYTWNFPAVAKKLGL